MFHLSGGEKEKQRQTADMRGENAEMKHPFVRVRAMRVCSQFRAAKWGAKQTD